MSDEELSENDLTDQIHTLNNEYKSKCQELSTKIVDKKTQLSQLQTKNKTQTSEDQKRRSKVKRLLNLKNLDFKNIDNPKYRNVYNQYGITTPTNGEIILFIQIDVNKIDKEWQTISDYTRKITITYNLNTKKFTVNIYRINNNKVISEYESLMETIEQGTNAHSFIINIPEQTSINPLMRHKAKKNTYYTDSINVSEFCSNIKTIFTKLKSRETETELKDKIKTIDDIIINFVKNNRHYIHENKKYINTNDTTYNIDHPFNNIIFNRVTWTHLSINRFFREESFYNYNKLLTVPSPVQYYIKKLIAQTLFSDLPSEFKYQEDKKKRLTDYNKATVGKLIDKPDYEFDQRFGQDELIFSGKVNDTDVTIKAILISSYSNKDELYIVDHDLNVYTLEGSAEFVAPPAAGPPAEAAEPAEAAVAAVAAPVSPVEPEVAASAAEAAVSAAPAEPPGGGKRSRRKRRKISKKKRIKTRKRLKRATIRYKKHRKKRTITRNKYYNI